MQQQSFMQSPTGNIVSSGSHAATRFYPKSKVQSLKPKVVVNMKKQEPIDRTKQAIALVYHEGEERAPRVVAKGAGYVAEKILAAAQQHAIPIYQNKTLSNMLMAVELDREIPPDLYKAVAEVLAYIYRLDQKLGQR